MHSPQLALSLKIVTCNFLYLIIIVVVRSLELITTREQFVHCISVV